MSDVESSAMGKLMAGPAPFSTPKLPSVVASLRAEASELKADDPRRARLLAQAEEAAKETIDGELWPLTHGDLWRIKALLVEASHVADDLSPVARQKFVESMVPELRARAMLRKAGTKGKVHVFTEEQAAEADPLAMRAINTAYIQRFCLTEDELPKASTPR